MTRAAQNIGYLEKELGRTSVVELQQAVSRLLEHQLKQAMLAKANQEFAFKVIDPAVPPRERARPKRTLIVIAGLLLGFGLSCSVIWAIASLRLRREVR